MVSDRNVEAVREALKDRASKGLQTYGVSTERSDLSELDWLYHLRNELLDGAVYAQRLIHDKEARDGQ